MANTSGIKNGKKTRFKSGDRAAKEAGRKGGIASGRAKRIRKTFRELDIEETTDDEIRSMLNMVKKLGAKGNLNAIKLYYEITGMALDNEKAEEYEDDGLLAALSANKNKAVDDLDMIEGEE